MLIDIMWQVKIPFSSEAEKEAAISRSSVFNIQGIWEMERELIVFFSLKETMRSFLDSFSDATVFHEKVNEKIEWVSHWKKFHKVVRIKPFLIVPSFKKGVTLRPPYTKKIIITPSFAFGTGSHPTTGMCVKYLVSKMKKSMNILDMGTGSGILAICAEKLGAARICAVDTDGIALKEAGKNAKKNHCSRIVLRGKYERRDGKFDLCVCNILCDDIIKLKGFFNSVLKRKGGLILSGLLADQREIINDEFGDSFTCLSSIKKKDKNFEWLALYLEKK